MKKFLQTLRKIFSPARIYAGDELPDFVKVCQSISNDSTL